MGSNLSTVVVESRSIIREDDVQNLLASEINGCVPLSASPDTSIGMIESAQAKVIPGSECPAIQSAQREQSHQPDAPLPIGARTLTPDEFAKRKAELEARDGTRYVMPMRRRRWEQDWWLGSRRW